MPVVKGKSGTKIKRRPEPATPGQEPASPSETLEATPTEVETPKSPSSAKAVKPIVLVDDTGKKIVLGVYSDGRVTIGRQGKSETKEVKPGRAPVVLTGRSGRKIGFGAWPDGTLVVAMGSYPGKPNTAKKPATPAKEEVPRAEWDESLEPTLTDSPTGTYGGVKPPVRGWKAVPLKRENAPAATLAARARSSSPGTKPLSPETLRQIRKVRRAPPREAPG